MSYRIVWVDGQIQQLANRWDQMTPSRQRDVTMALDALDQKLADRPLKTGESRDASCVRIAVQWPLVVWYRVNQRLQVVQIFAAYSTESD